MKRRIIRQGRDSITITLPIEWSRKHDLGVGKDVEVLEQDNCLVLRSPYQRAHEAVITANGDQENLRNQLISLYSAGAERIIIQFLQPQGEATGTVKEIVQKYFHGMEIDTREKSKWVISSYSTTDLKALDRAIRNCFVLILETATLCQEALTNASKFCQKQTTENHADVKRYCYYALRLLHQNPVAQGSIALASATGNLIEMSNVLRHMTKHYAGKRSKEVILAVQKMRALLEALYAAYYDVKKSDEFFRRIQELQDWLNSKPLEKEIKENLFMVWDAAKHIMRQAIVMNFQKS